MYYDFLATVVCIAGLLSGAVFASPADKFIKNEHGSNSLRQNPFGFSYPMNQLMRTSGSMSGIVKIHDSDWNMICSGVLLTNWLVLTAADCVQGRDPSLTFVAVVVKQENYIVTYRVAVDSIKIQPQYELQYRMKSLALLTIYGDPSWNAGVFHLPDRDYKTEDLINSFTETLVYESKPNSMSELIPDYVKVPLSTDFGYCGAAGTSKELGWYCVDRTYNYFQLTPTDRGTPLFFVRGHYQYLLGLFMGANEDVPGALYEAVYPSIAWINEQILDVAPPQ